MYERKRDTLPNPGHDLAARFGYFFAHILESRFTIQAQARTCKTKKFYKKWARYFGDKIVAVRGEQRDRTNKFIEEASASTPRF